MSSCENTGESSAAFWPPFLAEPPEPEFFFWELELLCFAEGKGWSCGIKGRNHGMVVWWCFWFGVTSGDDLVLGLSLLILRLLRRPSFCFYCCVLGCAVGLAARRPHQWTSAKHQNRKKDTTLQKYGRYGNGKEGVGGYSSGMLSKALIKLSIKSRVVDLGTPISLAADVTFWKRGGGRRQKEKETDVVGFGTF